MYIYSICSKSSFSRATPLSVGSNLVVCRVLRLRQNTHWQKQASLTAYFPVLAQGILGKGGLFLVPPVEGCLISTLLLRASWERVNCSRHHHQKISLLGFFLTGLIGSSTRAGFTASWQQCCQLPGTDLTSAPTQPSNKTLQYNIKRRTRYSKTLEYQKLRLISKAGSHWDSHTQE